MEWYLYLAVIGVGFIAGVINTLAANGSLLTLPLLISLGLPAKMANGTNRVAILLQTAVAADGFRRKKVIRLKDGLWTGLAAILGGITGAFIGIYINEEAMKKSIGIVMVIMFFVILIKPDRWIKGPEEGEKKLPLWLQLVIFYFIGVYGGFIQAGTGVFLLAGCVLGCGYDLVKANAAKALIMLLYTIFALAVYFIDGEVDLALGLLLASGQMVGAWLGVKIAMKWGAGFLRWMLLAAVLASSVKLLGIL
ncbi:MAG: sulfite exporter TauE/SafE family protein [Bacteroidota bacterium]